MTLTASNFSYISTLVRKEAGIVLDQGKEYLVESRLLPVVRKAGMKTIDDLTAALRSAGSRDLLGQVIDAMTTNETLFFRDRHPFDVLRDEILPELVKTRATERRLNFWCAAASTGQEPYSVAMTLKDSPIETAGWNIDFMATDIATDVLDKAKRGRYSQLEVNRGVPAPLLIKHFDRKGTKFQIKQDLQQLVRFVELNLTRPFPRMMPMDIVFIRNVLIYFDEKTKADILRRIHGVMAKDGYLFLGGTETILNLDVPFERKTIGRAVFYRPK